MRFVFAFSLFLISFFFQPLNAQAETWRFTAIRDWPPYMDEKLGERGLGYIALKNVLDDMGIELEIEYLPWKRAKYLPTVDERYVGYYCAWPEEVDTGFFASVPIFSSPIGVFSSYQPGTDKKSYQGIASQSIGLVKSYVYPSVYENHPLQERVDSDAVLIKFVLLGRTDYGVIDKYVLNYLLENNPELKAVAEQIQFYDQTVENKPLVIAFRDTKENRKRAKRLAAFMQKYSR
ncbi:transporter substrate-binding domain-containing protein [Terasakiella sp. SH-1]|uniref:substrate-binding periplasmic protein n=1 Tax=Terasakiella sp. SH-1 TaxID=2560057 RepID=UPI0010738052|nr:transporter substrate-binding domain-containing protein [Terasakiella sp. SH-1]